MRSGSLFSGTAALDMAAAEVFGARPVWFADVDPAASALLAHRYPGVPNLRDITAVDWDLVAVLAPVELVTAGWPCQPFSVAGKRKGEDDERALWPEVDRCLRALRPRWVLLENVPAVVAAGELERVANTLAALGYRFAWCCIPASAVGAPHRRERFFLAAVADARRDARAEDDPHELAAAGGSGAAADPDACGCLARDESERDKEDRNPQPGHEPDRHRLDWAGFQPAIGRWESVLGRPAPAPAVPGTRGGRGLNPELPEWMMGLPAGWITGVPGLTRAQQLKLAGNGVVWQQAAAAYRYLRDVLNADARAAA